MPRRERSPRAAGAPGIRYVPLLPQIAAFLLLSFPAACNLTLFPPLESAEVAGIDGGIQTGSGVGGVILEDPAADGAFGNAQGVDLPPDVEVLIEGTIDARGDVDIFDLGPAAVGDLVTIDVAGHDGLNTVAALFDSAGDLIDANDDRAYYGGLIDPFIAQALRRGEDHIYAGVAVTTAAWFASSSGRYDTGTYTLRVKRRPAATAAAARQQVVWLDFDGGEAVQIGMEPVEQMRAFSAEAVSSRLAGQTDYIVGSLLELIRRDYAEYDVVLYNSRDHAPPAGPHARVHFGNFNAAFLGLADSVDTGNAQLDQEAIVYADDLSLFESLQPSADEVAQALANIASHELGHLLGLEHTGQTGDLMATAASARSILEVDAAFTRAPLQSGVFPLGWQNDPELLLLNVGPNPDKSAAALLRIEDLLPGAPPAFRDDLPPLEMPVLQCGACAH